MRSFLKALLGLGVGCFGLVAPAAAQDSEHVIRVPAPEGSDEPEYISRPSFGHPDRGFWYVTWGNHAGDVAGVSKFRTTNIEQVTLSSISCKFVDLPVGTPVRIAIWQNQCTGCPFTTATLLHEQNVTVQANGLAEWNNYALSVPVTVIDEFWVAFVAPGQINGVGYFSLLGRQAENYVAGTSLFVRGPFGMNLANPGALNVIEPSDSFGFPTHFLLRAYTSDNAFTYQGELLSGGQAYTGQADVRFQIFRTQAGPNALDQARTIQGVNVSNGRFTVTIPAESRQFADWVGDTFLEIAVRTSPTGAFTTLTPRQRMTSAVTALAATYADVARVADSAGTADRAASANAITNNTLPAPLTISNGDPGLGTSGGALFTVEGTTGGYVNLLGNDAAETGILFGKPTGGSANAGIIHNNPTTPGGLIFRTGGNVDRMHITQSGYVGIGRTSPIGASKFDIEADATAGFYGGMYVNTQAGGWPFYGYSQAGGNAVWTYVNGATRNWIVNNSGDRLYVSNTGLVGIGTTPSTGGYRLELPNTAGPAGQGRANAWVTYSSRELKENIATITDPVGTLGRLRGVTFDWKAGDEQGKHAHDIGFIAEEVAAVLPELVTRTADGKATGLDYGRVVPVAVEAIKAQQKRIEGLEARNAELEARLRAIEEAIANARK
jgi:hypothetical protein